MCVFDVFNCKYCVCRLYMLHVVQPADITLQVFFKSAAQFLTVNSGRRFFNRTPSSVLRVNAPVQPRRPSTLTLVLIRRWTHLIPPLTSHSPFVPAASCPDPNIGPQVDQAYFAPPPPPPPGFNYDISKTSLLYRLPLICF